MTVRLCVCLLLKQHSEPVGLLWEQGEIVLTLESSFQSGFGYNATLAHFGLNSENPLLCQTPIGSSQMDKDVGKLSFDSTASSLLRRAKDHEQHAWAMLVQIYGPLVYYWCRKAALQQADAADVVQEVFQGVSANLKSFERSSVGGFRGWLRVITRNKLADFVRRLKKQPPGVGGTTAHQELQLSADPVTDLAGESATNRAEHELLHQALEMLRMEIKETTWRAFWLTTVANCEPVAVATQLGIGVASVYQSKSRALKRLREILDDLETHSVVSS